MSDSKKQASMGNRMTRNVNFCKALNPNVTIHELRTRLDAVIELYDDFKIVQTDIEDMCGPETIDAQYTIRAQMEDYYFYCVAALKGAIESYELNHQPQVNNNRNLVQNNQTADIKLERVTIPTFDGDYKKWPEFKDMFNSLVHNNASLLPVQKFHYLKNKLTDEAAKLIKSFHVTEANDPIAWKRISDRYEHKRYIVDCLLDSLFNQKPVRSENPFDIKSLIDNSAETIRELQVLGLPVNQWDTLLVYIVQSKLDKETHKQWELTLKKDDLPTFEDLENFLENRWQSLEMIEKSKSQDLNEVQQPVRNSNNRGFQNSLQNQNNKSQQKTFHTYQKPGNSSTYTSSCIHCNKEGHTTGFCPEYVSLSLDSKTSFVKSKNLCFNCLKPGHSLKACSNKSNCRHCGKRHHTSLHIPNQTQATDSNSSYNATNLSNQPRQAHAITGSSATKGQVLLATAIVYIKSASGISIPARALIDKGGDHSLIQEKFAKKLGLLQQKESAPIIGVGEVVIQSKTSLVKIEIESCIDSSFKLEVDTYTMKSITGNLPTVPIDRKNWPHLQGIKLADNQFEKSAPIQLLLGAEVYEDILLNGIIKKLDDSPTAVNSRLGWLLFGKVSAKLPESPNIQIHHSSSQNDKLEVALRSFWELEEVPLIRKLSVKEQQAEDIFQQSKYRNREGRYVVALPFDPSKATEKLGESRSVALQCLYRLEKRFKSNSVIKERYTKYIQNLIESNHIELVPQNRLRIKDHEKFYLPHHPVMKESSLTTKLRVVFNASQKTRSGISLNDKLLIGPKTQDDLFDILIRWRKHLIAFIADVEKMYRQVKIIEEHRDYQRLLWRFSEKEPISEYRITTVIDGTASAQFLATRALRQLAEDNNTQYPEASETVLNDFYVDDLSSLLQN